MNETCDPAAVRFGPLLYEPINARRLRAGAELGVPALALDGRQQAPVATRLPPVVR